MNKLRKQHVRKRPTDLAKDTEKLYRAFNKYLPCMGGSQLSIRDRNRRDSAGLSVSGSNGADNVQEND
jgi:hypothetical protein